MRILHLVSYPLYSGPLPGTLALALAQRRRGHTVWLACDTRRGNFDGYEEAALPHVAHLSLQPPFKTPLTLSTHASVKQHWGDYRALKGFLTPSHVDVVHCHLSHDHALAALCVGGKTPLVRTVHAARALGRRIGQKWLMRRADHFVVRCEAHAQMLEAQFAASQGRVTTIPGSIDAAQWQLADAASAQAARKMWRARYGIPDAALVLGQVALIAKRGQDELVAALTHDSAQATGQVHVVFVGDGECAQALRAEVVRRGLSARVHFTGYLGASELKEAYAGLDAALVMQAGNDAACRAGLEAMAAGLPLIAPKVDALGELVDDLVGYPLAARTSAAVSEALRAWCSNPQEGRARGQRGQARVGRARTIEQEAEATLAMYKTLVA